MVYIEMLCFFLTLIVLFEMAILISLQKKIKMLDLLMKKEPLKEEQSPIKVDVIGDLKGLKKVIVKYTNGDKLILSHNYSDIIKIDDILNKIEITLYGYEKEENKLVFYKTEVENYDEIREIFLNKDFK